MLDSYLDIQQLYLQLLLRLSILRPLYFHIHFGIQKKGEVVRKELSCYKNIVLSSVELGLAIPRGPGLSSRTVNVHILGSDVLST